MANTLTNLIPSMHTALDEVSRELIGLTPAVRRDGQTERAAIGQTVYSPVVPAATGYTITPAVDEPDTGDAVIGNVSLQITDSVGSPIRYNGEETLGLRNAGTFDRIMVDHFKQAYRYLANQIEAGLAAQYKYASRAYGTAGTTPFGTADNLTDLAGLHQILDDNGAPMMRRLVLSNAAMANLRGKQPTVWRVNEAGGDRSGRLYGEVGELLGFRIGQSGQMLAHTKGTGASYQLAEAGAVGETALDVDAGTGTILAGDIITFTGESPAHKYVNGVALNGGAITLNEPGLRNAIADNTALAVGNNYSVAGMAFSEDAFVLATRLPALPDGGDKAVDRRTVTDPVSGLTFEVSLYKEYRQNLIEVAIAWGYKAVKPAHAALLLG